MPICKKCDSSFKNLVVINGQQKNLSSRKYCLDCSPYGLHNTRKIEILVGNCKNCGKEFKPDRSKGHRGNRCNSCITLQRHKRVRDRALEYKGNKCSSCGYSKSKNALHFHHIDPATKSFTISGNYNRTWEGLKKELDKCVLVCANCHAETHEVMPS